MGSANTKLRVELETATPELGCGARQTHRRKAMMVPLLLGAKAEMVVGVFLVARHRTVRLACVLALTMVVLSLVQNLGRTPRAYQPGTVFLIAGTLAAVAGSRLLAPGGALAASRQVAALFWLVPFGRLTGALLVVLPVVTVAAFFVGTAESGHFQLILAAAIYAAAVASGVLALAPATGASAAAAAGFVAVWVGSVHPFDLRAMFENWPFLQRALVLMWHLLPFQWRAVRLLETFKGVDALVLIGWIVLGVVLAGWFTTPVRFAGRRFHGGA